jgi:hypothetical protein
MNGTGLGWGAWNGFSGSGLGKVADTLKAVMNRRVT